MTSSPSESSPVARTPGKISLPRGPVNAWAWWKRITGTCSCDPGYATVVVTVNGIEYETPREAERFSVTVRLEEGTNHIVAACRHHDGLACAPAEMRIRQRLEARPRAVTRLCTDGDRLILDGSASQRDETTGSPLVRYRWRAEKTNPARLLPRRTAGQPNPAAASSSLPGVDGEYRVSLTVTDARGRSDTATACFVVESGRARVPNLDRESPAWVESAIVYGVVPHSFGPHGFRSVTARLDALKDLGINAIWLSPCTGTKGRGHGYGVTDYFRLRRDYGTKRDFRELVAEAHARGIRVLMDFVPNHTSVRHPYMEHVDRYGKASPYRDFYEWQQDGDHFAYYFHWRHLPSLNYDNPEVRRWMIEAFSYWVRELDVDGFRVDAAWGVKLRRPDFWPEWRRELRRIKPDLLLLAEASARDPYYFTSGFDAAYDWTDELGKWAWERVFDDPDQIAARLRAALTNEGRGFHENALIFRFLNNNDTGPRFITRYGAGMERLAATMLLTLPGLPCIYTGQEIGAEFEPYRTSGPISWQGDGGLRRHYQRLISLRRSVPALHSRSWQLLEARPPSQCLAYLRTAGDQAALVVLNFDREPARPQVAVPTSGLSGGPPMLDLLSGELVAARWSRSGLLTLSLSGLSALVLVAPPEGALPTRRAKRPRR
ncbi:MAG: alpha-amylase family glycosyl hydrolase [Armatimonadota bacterium]